MTVNTRVSPSCTVADESSVDNCSSRSQASTAAPGSARGCQCCTACSWLQSLPDLYKDVPVRVGASAIDTQVVTDGLRPRGVLSATGMPRTHGACQSSAHIVRHLLYKLLLVGADGLLAYALHGRRFGSEDRYCRYCAQRMWLRVPIASISACCTTAQQHAAASNVYLWRDRCVARGCTVSVHDMKQWCVQEPQRV